MKILIVCLGNICRSPMAEGILRKKISDKKLNIQVDSAGTANYHVGEAPDSRAIRAAMHYGVDISHLRGRQFDQSDFDHFDRIYAMDTSNFRNILKLKDSLEITIKSLRICRFVYLNYKNCNLFLVKFFCSVFVLSGVTFF